MADTQLAELGGKLCGAPAAKLLPRLLTKYADTSPPVELHDTGLTAVEVIQKHSHFDPRRFHSPSAPSQGSMSGFGDDASFVSRASPAPHSPVVDSPLLGISPQLSSDSRPGAAHVGNFGRMDPLPSMSEEQEPPQESPLSITPPSGRYTTADDYLAAGETVSWTPKGSAEDDAENMSKLK